MYACILVIERGFFEGVCASDNATANFRDPPPIDARISTMVDTPWLPSSLGLCTIVQTDLWEQLLCKLGR
jgi:hypothetical protein